MAPNSSSVSSGFLGQGLSTRSVPLGLFAENRRRLVDALNAKSETGRNDLVVLQGGEDQGICVGDASDVGPVFKQEGFFHWAFGVLEPDFFGAIFIQRKGDKKGFKSILFAPRLSPEYAIWMGALPTPKDIRDKYGVDDVYFVDEMSTVLSGLACENDDGEKARLLTLSGINSDSGKKHRPAAFDGISSFEVDSGVLYPVMTECRVTKTSMEQEVMRYVTKVSSDAHKYVMSKIRPGMKQYQAEALFKHYVYFYGGCRDVCYTPIAGSGNTGSVLHYGHAGAPNDQVMEDGHTVLFDMGAEYFRYCSDITCCYPVNGKFNEKQKVIYNAVLAANRAVLAAMKPDVSWVSMHLLSNKVTLEHLKAGGLLKGDIEAMMEVNLAGKLFQPHGLGHLIGIEVHDVGGYLEGHPERPNGQGLRSLRTARVLKAGMAITVEPGCYFIDHLINAALEDPQLNQFIVRDALESYRGFGGVRIEDDVLVTETGAETMTDVPRTVEEIEEWMAKDSKTIENYLDTAIAFGKALNIKDH